MNNSTPLSDAARAVLGAASERAGHLARPAQHLPAGARNANIRSMLRRDLLEEVPAANAADAWRTDESGSHALRATAAGLQAVQPSRTDDADPAVITDDAPIEHSEPVLTGSSAPRRLRAAAQLVLAAWDDPAGDRPALPGAVQELRTALSTRLSARRNLAARPPRPDTKRATVLTLLRRPEGATVAQVAEATGWLRHTVHGLLAGLKNAGTPVEVLERVRQGGPGKQGGAGSYTVYHVKAAG